MALYILNIAIFIENYFFVSLNLDILIKDWNWSCYWEKLLFRLPTLSHLIPINQHILHSFYHVTVKLPLWVKHVSQINVTNLALSVLPVYVKQRTRYKPLGSLISEPVQHLLSLLYEFGHYILLDLAVLWDHIYHFGNHHALRDCQVPWFQIIQNLARGIFEYGSF